MCYRFSGLKCLHAKKTNIVLFTGLDRKWQRISTIQSERHGDRCGYSSIIELLSGNQHDTGFDASLEKIIDKETIIKIF